LTNQKILVLAGFTQNTEQKLLLETKNYLKTLVSMLVEDITHLIYGNLQWLTV
jgi:hypothetical protein